MDVGRQRVLSSRGRVGGQVVHIEDNGVLSCYTHGKIKIIFNDLGGQEL